MNVANYKFKAIFKLLCHHLWNYVLSFHILSKLSEIGNLDIEIPMEFYPLILKTIQNFGEKLVALTHLSTCQYRP